MKKSKRLTMGLPVLILVIALVLAGCATKPQYYNLGAASDADCALVRINNVSNLSNLFSVVSFIQIDGQGNIAEWKEGFSLIGTTDVIVRVTPGDHTLTTKYGSKNSSPNKVIGIIYNFKAGKGYDLELKDDGSRPNLILYEYDIDENGKFGGVDFSRKGSFLGLDPSAKEVAVQVGEGIYDYIEAAAAALEATSFGFLERIVDDYKENRRRGEADWKDKEIETMVRIVEFMSNGSVFVSQKGTSTTISANSDFSQISTRVTGASCSFNASEDNKLVNFDKGSRITIKGVIDDVKEVNGNGPFVFVKDCIIIN